MAFSLWNLFEASILCLNAICILNEDRFLSKIGWGYKNSNTQGFGEGPSTKAQIFNLLHSIRTVARVPLILLNALTIVLKLILG
ncbi:immediate early response 3-interacting protein 1 [Euwallacea similis]|uniref:immediate early response 3-interacting protein 1 n=1 Tax=Euwallacea similis TaxID=1736056 RepID=UPI0034510A72